MHMFVCSYINSYIYFPTGLQQIFVKNRYICLQLQATVNNKTKVHGKPGMKLSRKEAENKIQMLPSSTQDPGMGNSPEESPQLLLQKFLEAFWKLWAQLKLVASFIMIDLGGYRLLDNLLQWSVRNPHTAICIVAAFLVFLLPFLIMLGIGLSTLLMTLTGFLFLEGVLLTMVAMLLSGCLGAIFLMVLFLKQLRRTVN